MLNQKLKIVLGFFLTLVIIHFVPNTLQTLCVLLPFWVLLFFPWTKADVFTFIIVSVFFLGQNYMVLQAGGFAFKHQDVILMPYYEPFLWGYYFLSLKRFINEPANSLSIGWKAILGFVLTGVCFSFFAKNSSLLLVSTALSTAVLLLMFHEPYDLYYAIAALILGFLVELFGVTTGLWSYPRPDFLGIPFWFATMWLSVGLLARRFVFSLTYWLGGKFN